MFFTVSTVAQNWGSAKNWGSAMRIMLAMAVATLLLALDVNRSSAQIRPCKVALDYCLANFVRPGTNDAAGCRAAYAQAMKTGRWPAHPATNSPGFPCLNK